MDRNISLEHDSGMVTDNVPSFIDISSVSPWDQAALAAVPKQRFVDPHSG